MSLPARPWTVPDTWTWVLIGEVASVVGGATPQTTEASNFDDGTVPWVTPADLSGYGEKYIGRGSRNITTRGLKNSGARVLPKGTVLFSSRAPIGYVAIARNPLATNQGFKSFVLPPGLDPEFLYYYLLRAKELAVGLSSGTTFQEVSGRQAAKIPLSIAPFREQHRIVEAIETYFTRLDDAVGTLERVQHNLKRYRAAVLKAAVEGRLVPIEAELARAEGRDYEPASVLLDRILAERRRRWEEAELAKMKAKGKVAKDDKWKARYEEPVAPEFEALPSVPKGWCWATVDQLAFDVRYGSSAKTDPDLCGEIPVLRMGNIADGVLSFADLKYLPVGHPEFPELLLEPGDILFNRTNSAELVGKTAVFRGHPTTECSFASYLIRVRCLPDVEPEYIAQFVNSFTGRSWIASVVSQQVGQANVNGTKLKACAVPLPPASEQARIVARSDRLLSLASQLAVELQREQIRCARVRQSILKWAFEGRLVDQDPTDEPASALLERIRAERASVDTIKPKRAARRNARSPRA
jgi:type I restriction enzyme S subunit